MAKPLYMSGRIRCRSPHRWRETAAQLGCRHPPQLCGSSQDITWLPVTGHRLHLYGIDLPSGCEGRGTSVGRHDLDGEQVSGGRNRSIRVDAHTTKVRHKECHSRPGRHLLLCDIYYLNCRHADRPSSPSRWLFSLSLLSLPGRWQHRWRHRGQDEIAQRNSERHPGEEASWPIPIGPSRNDTTK